MKFYPVASALTLLSSPCVTDGFAPFMSPFRATTVTRSPLSSPQLDTIRADVALDGQKKKPKKKKKKKSSDESPEAADVGGGNAVLASAVTKDPATAAPQKDNEPFVRSMLAYRFQLEAKERVARAALEKDQEAKEKAALAAKLEQEEKERLALALKMEQEAKAKAEQERLEQERLQREAEEKAALVLKLEQEKLEKERLEQERLQREEEERQRELTSLNQPKPPEVEKRLQEIYGSIPDTGERAFAILTNLGLVQVSPDPSDPDYDSSRDNELVHDLVRS